MKNYMKDLLSLMLGVQKTTTPLFNHTGGGSWPGFVPPSTMRKFHKGIGSSSKYKRHQGAKECTRRCR